MTDYGLKVWGASGDVKLTITDKLSRMIYSTDVGSSESDSVTLSLTGIDTIQFAVSLNYLKKPHVVTRVGNTIYWAPHPADNGESRVIVMAYT